jgi:GNAT superfamily N-acetyltransferase
MGKNMENEKDNILRLTKADVKAAAATLANAFVNYPVSVFFTPDEAKRKKRQPGISRRILRNSIKSGEVYITSPKMEGVAIWMLNNNQTAEKKRKQSLRDRIGALSIDKETKKRQQAFFEYSDSIRKRVLPAKYWYLQMLGVNPAYQGKGFSSRLVKPMLARAEKEGLPVFLETQLKKNVTLYEHFGFKVVEDGMIPGSTVNSWAMVKEPKQG